MATIGIRVIVATLLLAAAAVTARAQTAPDFYLDLDTGGHRAFVKDLAFTADGEFLVSASDDKTIRIWDWKSRVSVRTLRGQIGIGNDGKIFAVAVSPDGKTIAAGGYFGPGIGETPPYGDVRLFDFASGKLKAVLKGADYAIYDLAFSPDGQFLAAGGQEGYVFLWKQDAAAAEGWAAHAKLDADSQHISQVAFAAGGTRLAVATTDNGIRLWDMGTEEEITLPDEAEALRDVAVPALAVSLDGTRFATGSADGRVDVWTAADGRLEHRLPQQDFVIGALSFAGAASDHLVASCGYRCADQNRTLVWHIGDDRPVAEYRGHDGTVLAGAVTPDGLTVATAGGLRHAIHLWNPLTGEPAKILQGLGRPVMAVGFDPRTLTVGWGTENPCPDEVACPETLGMLTMALQLPTADRYFEHPEPLASALSYRRSVHSLGGFTLRVAPGGQGAPENAVLEVVKDGAVLHQIENDATNGYLHAAYTLIDGGKRFVTGGNDGTLAEYDSGSGAFVGTFTGGHTGEIHAMAALEAENLLVTGSADQTLRLWNLQTRELIVSMYFDDKEWVAWLPQGYYYSSDDGDVRFGWHINQGAAKEGRFVRAGQLKSFLNSPELVRRAIILRSAKAAVAEMRPNVGKELERLLERKPPEFEIKLADDQSGVRDGFVAIEIVGAEAAEADVDGFSILSNSRNVGGLTTRSVSGDSKKTIVEVPVAEGENRISITGANSQGYLTERSVTALGKKKREAAKRGKLYAVVIGVNKYPYLTDACSGRACDLKFPVDDATAFLDVISKKTAPLFSGMESLVLVNAESINETMRAEDVSLTGGKGILEPNSDTIADELKDFLDQPGPDDTTIVFVAGHGINIDEDYYFIPTDGRKQDAEKWKRSSLVEWSDIQKSIERAEGTRFLMLDTCHAANAFNPRLEKDAADARIVVFSATAANNTAQERAELGHGVFTYTLLEGLRGAAKTSNEGVTLFGLADYVGREVTSLTSSQQKPFYYVGGIENVLMAQP